VSSRTIRWKVAFRSSPDRVYQALASEACRRSFWALEAAERDGAIAFRFPNGVIETSRIVAAQPPRLFEIVYSGAPTRFEIEPAGEGAVLTLTAEGAPSAEWEAVHAGWVAVLLALKAHVDFGIDLRNGDPACSWDAGFVDP
jgi:uncharacterized protein YndB with AHSA1/START domain